jgi:hypothetical protein
LRIHVNGVDNLHVITFAQFLERKANLGQLSPETLTSVTCY